MYLRHPKAAALRDVFQYKAHPSYRFLTHKSRSLLYLLMNQAGRKIPLDYTVYGAWHSLYPNGSKAFRQLVSRGYLRKNTLNDAFSSATIPEIKALLDEYSIAYKSSARKTELIELATANVPNPALSTFKRLHSRYFPSEKGFRLLRSLYDDRLRAERKIFKLALSGDYIAASRYADRYNSDLPKFRFSLFGSDLSGSTLRHIEHVIAERGLVGRKPTNDEAYALIGNYLDGHSCFDLADLL